MLLGIDIGNTTIYFGITEYDEVKKRFSPNILFKYQFHGIEKFMPWINVVHLLII